MSGARRTAHLGRDMDGDMDPTGSLPGPFLPFDGQEETWSMDGSNAFDARDAFHAVDATDAFHGLDAMDAMDALHIEDTFRAMDAMDATDAMDTFHAIDAMDTMDALHIEDTFHAMDAMDAFTAVNLMDAAAAHVCRRQADLDYDGVCVPGHHGYAHDDDMRLPPPVDPYDFDPGDASVEEAFL